MNTIVYLEIQLSNTNTIGKIGDFSEYIHVSVRVCDFAFALIQMRWNRAVA